MRNIYTEALERTAAELPSIEGKVKEIMERELAGIYGFTRRLARGELAVW